MSHSMSTDRIPTTVKSRLEMLPHVPAAKDTVASSGAEDLFEVIFGEDA